MTLQQVAELLENVGEAFAKPISDSSSGIGCALIKIENGVDTESGRPVADRLAEYVDNYMISELIHCSEDVAKIHPASVNTFRIMTYRLNGEIYSCPSVMRVGRHNNSVDNAHAGGLVLGISDDGIITSRNGITEFNERVAVHPDTDITFCGYAVRNFDKCLAMARKLHALIENMDIMSWDFTINQNEEPTFIEMNTLCQSPWLPQMAHGVGIFEENTERMLRKLRERTR